MKAPVNQLIEFVEYTDEKFIPQEINDAGEFLRICGDIKTLDKIPLKKLDVTFSEDYWDLSPLTKHDIEAKQTPTFVFAHVSIFKEELKFYIYWMITRKKKKTKMNTIHTGFSYIRQFLRYLESKHIVSLDIIDFGIISDYIKYLKDDRGNSYNTIQAHIRAVRNFILFYSSNMTNIDMSHILKQTDKSLSKLLSLSLVSKEGNKYDTIPDEYFDKLLSMLIGLMRDEDLDIKTRGYAAFTILMSQTGLRIIQMLSLKINALSKTHISHLENASYFLEYTVVKKDVYETAYTVLNELGYEAYALLEELFKDKRKRFKTDYLFCPPYAKAVPVSEETFARNLLKIIIKHGDDLGAVNAEDDYPELSTISIAESKERDNFSKEVYIGYSDDDIISFPTSHQFRVHLCTFLYHKGVPLMFIQKYMNHLTEEMTDYYVRGKDSSEQDSEFADKVLEVIIGEDTKPLGSGSDALMFKINEFIKEGKFNVVEDLDKIISKVKGRVPIRQKTGGMCIKSAKDRECTVDGQSDAIYCAYGVCPNHFHLYIMADITYNECRNLIKVIEYNKASGYLRQANKELNKLQSAIDKSLKPEIEQLEDTITKKGVDWVKEKHENLIPIIDKLDEIKKEMDEWIKKEPLTLKNS